MVGVVPDLRLMNILLHMCPVLSDSICQAGKLTKLMEDWAIVPDPKTLDALFRVAFEGEREPKEGGEKIQSLVGMEEKMELAESYASALFSFAVRIQSPLFRHFFTSFLSLFEMQIISMVFANGRKRSCFFASI